MYTCSLKAMLMSWELPWRHCVLPWWGVSSCVCMREGVDSHRKQQRPHPKREPSCGSVFGRIRQAHIWLFEYLFCSSVPFTFYLLCSQFTINTLNRKLLDAGDKFEAKRVVTDWNAIWTANGCASEPCVFQNVALDRIVISIIHWAAGFC